MRRVQFGSDVARALLGAVARPLQRESACLLCRERGGSGALLHLRLARHARHLIPQRRGRLVLARLLLRGRHRAEGARRLVHRQQLLALCLSRRRLYRALDGVAALRLLRGVLRRRHLAAQRRHRDVFAHEQLGGAAVRALVAHRRRRSAGHRADRGVHGLQLGAQHLARCRELAHLGRVLHRLLRQAVFTLPHQLGLGWWITPDRFGG